MNAYGSNQYQNCISYTLCWDCKNACGGCRWSDSLIPVKGWKATPTYNKCQTSYIVKECPEFIRDAQGGGLKRYRKEEHNGD